MSPAQPAEAPAVTDTLDNVLHELRRALSQPIPRIHKGELGPMHEMAIARRWLAPDPKTPALLALTNAGLKVLAQDQLQRGLRFSHTGLKILAEDRRRRDADEPRPL